MSCPAYEVLASTWRNSRLYNPCKMPRQCSRWRKGRPMANVTFRSLREELIYGCDSAGNCCHLHCGASCRIAIIFLILILIVRWGLLKNQLLFPASEQEIGVNLVQENSIALEKTGLKQIFVVAARMTPTIVGLLLSISFINELRSLSAL